MIALAEWELFSGTGGDAIDGMRFVSILVAALLFPLALWWFFMLREPGFAVARQQRKSTFWHDMRKTVSSRSFLILVAIVFTLAIGFNFVQIFNYYITIFYLYGGDSKAASGLLGWGGTVWAITGLLAVFPLNWISKRIGKNKTLLVAILLMCVAQLSKIFCYRPGILGQFEVGWFSDEPWTITIPAPYLVLIPTILLSAGMLMFFTLGSSMVGDVADEDELKTGTRSEGSFFSVFWWFISMGTAFAGLVMGALIVFTAFDEQQSVAVEAMQGNLERIKADALAARRSGFNLEAKSAIDEHFARLIESSDALRLHFAERAEEHPDLAGHLGRLVERNESVRSAVEALRKKTQDGEATSREIASSADVLMRQMPLLKRQSPKTLLRLRVVEIAVPLALSVVSILLTLRYPLTEGRCYEIKEALQRRRGALAD